MTVPWTPGLSLVCIACGERAEPSFRWHGCESCGAPLETSYDASSPRALALAEELLTDLGRAPTPLVPLPGSADTWLKLEYRNPTASHKDRLHAITSALARLAGAPGVVTVSTGNHGVSCAAHAARDDLGCVVLSTGELPPVLEAQIGAYGAIVGRLAPAECDAVLLELVARGWHPATATDPALAGAGNPFGMDGYRAVADEILAELGRVPEAVAVPVASGDTFVGILRGFEAHAARGGGPLPIMLACQPAGAASLEASVAAGRPVVLDHPHSIARSTADPSAGRLSIAALASSARAVVVPDSSIADSTRRLATAGHYVETSSALALAGLERARASGLVPRDATGVAIVTASGRGWSEDEPAVVEARRTATSRLELLDLLA